MPSLGQCRAQLLWRVFNQRQLRQAANDDGMQLGRSYANVAGLLALAPTAIIIAYTVMGMLSTWW